MKTWPVQIAALVLLAGAGGLMVAKLKDRPPRAKIAADQGILTIGNGTDIATLDPHKANGQPEHYIISSLFEGLVSPDPGDPDKDAPGVALSWDQKDYVQWTFKLRPDARWSDGKPVTAEDFVYAWKRILTPELGSPYAEMLYLVKGASDYHGKKTSDFSTVGVKAPDPLTLEVTLDGPVPHFPGMLKHYAWYPVPKQAIDRFGGASRPDTPWARPGNIVSNGPFVLDSWLLNRYVLVKRNPSYWDAASVKLNGIQFFSIDNAEPEERVFLDNQLHITKTVPLSKIPIYRKKRPVWFHESPELTTEFYRCNVTRPPLDNPKVRQALALALDRSALIDKVLQNGHQPATGLVPPQTNVSYPALGKVHFNPEEAKKTLAEAGFPDGKGFRKIELLTNSNDSARTVAEFFQESWRRHLGIEVSIVQQEWQVYLDSMQNLKYDVIRGGWVGDYLDPFTFLSIMRSMDGNNNTGWKNDRYDELMLSATREKDPAVRFGLLRQGEELLYQEMPIIPIFWRMDSRLQRPEIVNWKESVIGHRCYKAVSLGPYQPLAPLP